MLVCVLAVKVLSNLLNFSLQSSSIFSSSLSISERQSINTINFVCGTWSDSYWIYFSRIWLPNAWIKMARSLSYLNGKIISFYLSIYFRYCWVQFRLLESKIGWIFFCKACFMQLIIKVVLPPLALPRTSNNSPSSILPCICGYILDIYIKIWFAGGVAITFFSNSCVLSIISCRWRRHVSI